MNELHRAALTWHATGHSVIPVVSDGSKRPAVRWKQYQSARATVEQIDEWFGGDIPKFGLGIVCGEISQNLLMIEWEGRAVAEGLIDVMGTAMDAAGYTELWERATQGCSEWTPTRGVHIYVHVDGPGTGNQKLARRPATDAELADNPADKVKVLIETRYVGGYSVVAPTGGEFHPTGNPWASILGSPETIVTLTVEERDNILAVANSLDQMPTIRTPEASAPGTVPPGATAGVRPGDDYNNRAQWEDILIGWTRVKRIGSGYGWRRPGKTSPGISATTGTAADGVDRLYVFSTSTDFEPETPYSKFGAYTHLNHNGDFTAATKKLASQGYGSRRTPPVVSQMRTKAQREEAKRQDAHADPASAKPAGSPFDTASPPDSASSSGPDAPTGGGAAAAPEPDTRMGASSVAYPRFTDAGSAIALINLHGDRLRFDCDRNRWLFYTGQHWELQPPGGGEARELAMHAAMHMPVGDRDKEAARWQNRALATAGVTAILAAAQTNAAISVHTNQLDADPYLLGTPGGVVDLRTGKLRAGQPSDLITRTTTVTPDFGPEPQIWLDFLDTTFSGDQEMIGYVQRIFGLALIGEVLEQFLPLFYGQLGANGKSTILDTALAILGISEQGYATSVPAEILMVRRHEGHPTELAQMAGRRLIVTSELEDGQRLAEARVKMLTGRDVISARFLYGQPFTFNPSHLVIMVGNNKPHVTIGGPALWRRLRSVPFEHQMPLEQRDVTLPQKLLGYGGHILAWMIRGAIDYLDNGGIRTPEKVTAATADYERSEDSLGRFLEDRCKITPAATTVIKEFREAYERWCAESGDHVMSPKKLTQDLESRFGVTSKPSGGKGPRIYLGVMLYAEETEEPARPWDEARYGK